MTASRRFYLPEIGPGPALCVSGDEAHHLARVLRLGVGDCVTLFDGTGEEVEARIDRVAPHEVSLQIVSRHLAGRAAARYVTLAAAAPKGERLAWLVEKATELGIDRLVLLTTSRSIVHPGEGKLEKLRKTIIESSKQCGRSRLMTLAEPVEWPEFVAREFSEAQVLIGDPSGEAISMASFAGDKPLILAVGPEGGFTAEELALARQHGARLGSLGPQVLRVETAALALAAIGQVATRVQ